MSQTPQQQGTTLEILAPYLPYGIEVETGIDDGEHERKQLHGLTQDGYPRTRLHGLEEAASFSDMLPVLRPFSALCEPLEDGTVPAVEVAKRMVTRFGRETVDWPSAIATLESGIVCVDFRDGGQVFIWPDLRGLEIEATDWLRANHFALPVNGRPLVEGVDFIPKSSARPTKEEGGKP